MSYSVQGVACSVLRPGAPGLGRGDGGGADGAWRFFFGKLLIYLGGFGRLLFNRAA